MKNNKLKKQDIIAYNNFWIDCYTSMLNAVVVSLNKDYEHIVYNNSYTYNLTKMKHNGYTFYEVNINMNHDKIINNILLNKQSFRVSSKKEIAKTIINSIEQNKICMARIDLYNLIKDNIHWQKNHITHLSLVYGYDLEFKIFNILETGNLGYQEYAVPFENVYSSIDLAGGIILTYDRGENIENLIYSENDIKLQGRAIVESIDMILEHEDEIFNIDGMDKSTVDYFIDINASNLLGIRYRQKANRFLFETLHYEQQKMFTILEDEYEVLRSKMRKYQIRKTLTEYIDECKEIFIELLKKEKNIWLDI